MKLDLYLSRGASAELIGTGSIVLQDLLKENLKGTVKSVIHIMSSTQPNVQIAVLNYRMRLRNSILQAIKWFREKSLQKQET